MSADKPKISRAHAACILFGKSHTRDNEVDCLSKLDELGYGLILCRYGNPERLVLVTNTYLNQHPSHYTEYPVISGSDDSKDQSSRESSPECGLLYGDRDILDFFNATFRSRTPEKDDARPYLRETLSIDEIYNRVSDYVSRFRDNDKPASAFQNGQSWADGTETRSRKREVFLLNRNHWRKKIDSIVNQTKNYLEWVQEWKSENLELIGYARKSPDKTVDDD
ncbi:hypothetical protein VTP01DRAFT_1523 [Rhizomucor pusillus]|uniref:uncharacterized protein n=1 Tax=Rhizomucor pusillus TaxID=4840 RepID=UPI0037429F79